MKSLPHQTPTLCPSARENSPDSVIFGIAAGTVEEPRVAYLPEIQPVTAEILALAQPVTRKRMRSFRWERLSPRAPGGTGTRRSNRYPSPLSNPAKLSLVVAGGKSRLSALSAGCH